jgi:hypothetical protein
MPRHLNVFAEPSAADAEQTESVLYMSTEVFVNPLISVEQLKS